MIYLDNAATGGFKIRAVTEAVETVIKYLSANPGRSGHALSVSGARIVEDCRFTLADFFGGQSDRVVFTKNCTEALNLAILGTLKEGKHVVTTVFEHNSVLRPLFNLQKRGLISLTVVCPDENGDLVKPIENAITDNTYLLVINSASNVTGEVLPLDKIGEIAREKEIMLLVDGAQGGGHIPLNLEKQNISMLALAGHKGLGGIMGLGALLFDKKTNINPIITGGTGGDTFNLLGPTFYPDALEAGTLNLPGIYALKEGVNYLSKNLSFISESLYNYTSKTIELLKFNPKIKLYSKPNPIGIVSFEVLGLSSETLAYLLDNDYDVAVRGAFHCAPLLHKYLKTDKDGLVRVSFSVQNTYREIDYLYQALNKITSD